VIGCSSSLNLHSKHTPSGSQVNPPHLAQCTCLGGRVRFLRYARWWLSSFVSAYAGIILATPFQRIFIPLAPIQQTPCGLLADTTHHLVASV